MNIYTAEQEVNHEGTKLLGVFSSSVAALQCCTDDVDEHGDYKGDRYLMSTYALDSKEPLRWDIYDVENCKKLIHDGTWPA